MRLDHFENSLANLWTRPLGENSSQKVGSTSASPARILTLLYLTEEEEEESEEEEEEEEEEAAETQPDGLQTPSGMETPSGMASVVSTVAGGLETPDFLELRKNATRVSDVGDSSRSLYQVVPERQTSVRGLMGSDRAYDISGVSAQSLPVLGEERGTKVRVLVEFGFQAN
jgi:hypothetical protein